MLEPTKEKILQIIKSSKILSILAHNPSELLSYKDEDIVTVKDLTLKRFCFLVANNEKLRISKGLEAELLLSETNNEKLETSEGLEVEVLLSDEISESSVEALLSEANNEKLEIPKDSETATLLLEEEALLKIISFNNSNYDIYDNLKKNI
ncbi:hypothetical protein [Rickettsia endosymbiont of Cantharis rufa]|uniref:hypothetical protein n=1 Tax=Rickettsia endosymbiont of Cantharis rufa TaxID=3066248 RepID=UPI003132E301